MKIITIVLTLCAFSVSASSQELKALLPQFNSINTNETPHGCGNINTHASLDSKPEYAHDTYLCSDSKSPLFKNKDHSDILEMEITVDVRLMYKDAQSIAAKKKYPAVLKYVDNQGKTVKIPAITSIKGRSRQLCEYVPMEFTFLTESEENNIKETKELYAEVAQTRGNSIKGVKQDNNIFDKLGRSVRLVTHCGDPGDEDWLSGKTKDEQNQKLLLEFYLYQILDTLKSTTLKTRLVKTTYRDPSGNVLDVAYSFFKESRKDVAKRCNLSLGTSEQIYGNTAINHKGSHSQLKILEYLVANPDYGINIYNVDDNGVQTPHNGNVYRYVNSNGERVFAPYDFDSTMIYGGEASGSVSAIYDEQKDNAAYIRSKKEEMLQVARSSLLNPELKSKLESHILNIMNQIDSKLK